MSKYNIDVWRIHAKTGADNPSEVADYFLNNNCIAVGWSLLDKDIKKLDKTKEEIDEIIYEKNNIKNVNDYETFYKKYGDKLYPNDKGGLYNTKRLAEQMKPGHLVWMRIKGIYYIGRVSKDSTYIFCKDNQNKNPDANLDVGNQRNDIKWYKIGGESHIPAKVSTSFIRSYTLQRIKNNGVKIFSQYIFNKKLDKEKENGEIDENIYKKYYFPIEENIIDEEHEYFFSLLTTDDCEDLLCLWLYSNEKYGYVSIPSTSKKSTELYECVLRDPKSGNYIYPQVKNAEINAKEYVELANENNSEVWLFTTNNCYFSKLKNEIDKINEDFGVNIKTVSPKHIYNFVCKSDNDSKIENILPHHILDMYEFVKNI